MKNIFLLVFIILTLLSTASFGDEKVIVVPLSTTSQRNIGTQILSIPAGAFQPTNGTILYSNHGYYIKCKSNSPSCTFLTPVYLPNGATVSKLTFSYKDCSNNDGYISLYRITRNGTEIQMAHAVSSGGSSSSDGSSGSCKEATASITAIDEPIIDNVNYAYYLWLNLLKDLNDVATQAYSITIEYTE